MVVVMMMVTMLFVALQRELGLKLQMSGTNSYRGGVRIVCGKCTSVMMVVPMVIIVTMPFAALQRVLGLKFRIS